MVTLLDIDPAVHARRLFDWRQLPDVARHMYSQAPLVWERHVAWLDRLPTDRSRRHWIVAADDQPVGSVYLTDIDLENARADFGMYIAVPGARLRGVGAAAESLVLDHAFDALGLQKVSCEVMACNEAPLRMHARMGFQLEGILRRHARRDGSWVDVHRLSVLAEEWWDARGRIRPALQKLLTASTTPVLS